MYIIEQTWLFGLGRLISLADKPYGLQNEFKEGCAPSGYIALGSHTDVTTAVHIMHQRHYWDLQSLITKTTIVNNKK